MSWNAHCEYMYVKAIKRLHGLRILKRSGLSLADLVSVYCSIIRAVLEYDLPAWAAPPKYHSDLIKSVQKKALKIIYPDASYETALGLAKLDPLYSRREESCRIFIAKCKMDSGLLMNILRHPTIIITNTIIYKLEIW